MIRHHVMFTFADGVSDAAQQGALTAMRRLLESAPWPTSWELHHDAGLVPGNASVLLSIDFSDAESFRAFQRSDDHQHVLHAISPLMSDRCAIQVARP